MAVFLKTIWKRHQQVIGLGLICLIIMEAFLTQKNSRYFVQPTAFWEHAASCAPHASTIWMNYGSILYMEAQDLTGAQSALERSLALYPSQAYAHENLARVEYDLHNYQEASAQATLALEQDFEINTYYLLGAIKLKLGEIEEARQIWENVTAQKPEHKDAQLALTQYYLFIEDDPEKALRHYEMAKKLGIGFSPEIEARMNNYQATLPN